MRPLSALASMLPRSISTILFQFYRSIRGHHRESRTRLVKYHGGLYLAFKDNFTDQLILDTGGYEKHLQRIMKSVIKDDWTIFDIGANTGVHSILMAKRAKNAITYAFEPVDYNYRKLNTNVYLSGLRNILIFPLAIGESTGDLTLNTVKPTRMEQGSSSLVLNEHLASLGPDAFSEKTVHVTSLDEFVAKNDIQKVDFIKMDIEGYEYFALLGMKNILSAHRPMLIIEYNLTRIKYLDLSNSHMEEVLSEYYDCYEISKYDVVAEYSLDPFNFDRHIEADLPLYCKGRYSYCVLICVINLSLFGLT